MNFIRKFNSRKKTAGQSFIELAIMIPLLLFMLTGLVEIAFVMFTYMTVTDLTREAARFASIRDYRELVLDSTPAAACTDNSLHYFYDTACFFTDPKLNSSIDFRANKFDDVVITVFTIANNHVTNRHPSSGYWSLYSDNWKKDCQGNVVTNTPFFSNARIESDFLPNAPTDRGLVVVEAYVCQKLILNLPLVTQFLTDPYRIHVYTVMPAPEGLPTPTPIPTSP
jgi:hypothetical protein